MGAAQDEVTWMARQITATTAEARIASFGLIGLVVDDREDCCGMNRKATWNKRNGR